MTNFDPHEVIKFKHVLEDIKDTMLTKEKNLGVSIIVCQTFNTILAELDNLFDEADVELSKHYKN